MAATMRDVAEAAGVSIATVSFVVNDTKPRGPGDAAPDRGGDGASSGFRRNMVARALASRRTRIVALVYPAMEHKLGRVGRWSSSPAPRGRPARPATTWCCGR